MIYYTYRWFFAALFSLSLQCLGYFYMISLPLNEMITLRKQEQSLIKKSQSISANDNAQKKFGERFLPVQNHLITTFATPKLPLLLPKNEFEQIANLVKIFKIYHLRVVSIEPVPIKIESADFIQFSIMIQGQFQDFLFFLFRISLQNPVEILDFSSQSINNNANQLHISITLLLWKNNMKTITKIGANKLAKEKFKENLKENFKENLINREQPFCPPQGFHLNMN